MKSMETFSCETWQKEFTTKFSLNRHQLIHNNEKRFTWRFCPKKFALKQYLREHECIHTNSRPYVCGVNGCEERFRQRGKLSLHRRKHKGYKMKEYNLIRKNGDMSHDASEVDTLMDHIHQEYQDSLNESSGGLVNTAKPSKVSKGNSSRKSKKRPVKDEESDSDFEPPSYSIKKAVNRQRRSIKRHSAMKAPVQDIEMDTLHERSNMAISEEEVHKSDDNSDKEPTLVLASQTEGEKKANNDSTHEGSIWGKKVRGKSVRKSRIQVNQNLEANHTDFRKVSSKIINSEPSNFRFLLEAADIHTKLLNNQEVDQKCGYPDLASLVQSVGLPKSLVNTSQSLNSAAVVLNNQNFNSLNNGVGEMHPPANPFGYFNLN